MTIPFFDGNDVRLLSARFGLATALSFVGAARHALQVSLELVALSWGWGVGVVCGGSGGCESGKTKLMTAGIVLAENRRQGDSSGIRRLQVAGT